MSMQMSDRRGRTRIIAIAMTGQMIDALGILAVCTFSRFIPGGYWALLVAPIIAGILGGVNTVGSTLNAYIADCTDLTTRYVRVVPAPQKILTDSMQRSRYFSLVVGLVFVGYSIGPTLGSLIITWTGSTLSVFHFSTLIHGLYVLAALFIIPESLSAAQMAEFRRAHHEEGKRLAEERAEGGVTAWLMSAFGFLRPLALLLPVTIVTPEGKTQRSWSLFLLAAGYGSMISLKVRRAINLARASALTGMIGRHHVRIPIHVANVWMDVKAGERHSVDTVTLAVDVARSWVTTLVPSALRVQYTSWSCFRVGSFTLLYSAL